MTRANEVLKKIDEASGESVTYLGKTYLVSSVKERAASRHESPVYGVKLTGKDEVLYIPSCITFREGYSQGTGRSELGYYQQSAVAGSASNGGGNKTPSVRLDTREIQDFLNGESYDHDWKDPAEKIVSYPAKTSNAILASNYK